MKQEYTLDIDLQQFRRQRELLWALAMDSRLNSLEIELIEGLIGLTDGITDQLAPAARAEVPRVLHVPTKYDELLGKVGELIEAYRPFAKPHARFGEPGYSVHKGSCPYEHGGACTCQ